MVDFNISASIFSKFALFPKLCSQSFVLFSNPVSIYFNPMAKIFYSSFHHLQCKFGLHIFGKEGQLILTALDSHYFLAKTVGKIVVYALTSLGSLEFD